MPRSTRVMFLALIASLAVALVALRAKNDTLAAGPTSTGAQP